MARIKTSREKAIREAYERDIARTGRVISFKDWVAEARAKAVKTDAARTVRYPDGRVVSIAQYRKDVATKGAGKFKTPLQKLNEVRANNGLPPVTQAELDKALERTPGENAPGSALLNAQMPPKSKLPLIIGGVALAGAVIYLAAGKK